MAMGEGCRPLTAPLRTSVWMVHVDAQKVIAFLDWITRTGDRLHFQTVHHANTGETTEGLHINSRPLARDTLSVWAQTWLEDQGVRVTDEAVPNLVSAVEQKLIHEHSYPPSKI